MIDSPTRPLPNPMLQPVLTVEEAGKILGFGRSKAYVEARRWIASGGTEGMPCKRYGRAMRVPTANLLAHLGVTA